MPRDLEEEKGNVWKGLAQLQRSPDEVTTTYESPAMDAEMRETPPPQGPDLSSTRSQGTVKPYVQSLTFLDLDSCVKLEEVTFPPQERCSREKFEYRFAKCGELTLGLFTSADTTLATASSTVPTTANPGSAETASTAVPVYSGTPNRKAVLLGHIIATKTTNDCVRDEDMALPDDWRTEHARGIASPSVASPPQEQRPRSRGGSRPGHKEEGRTICIHSLSVLPDFQRQGLGKLLLRSYIQRMESSGLADRIAIITHSDLVPFYESMGFESRGESPVQFGGGAWTDMVLDLRNQD